MIDYLLARTVRFEGEDLSLHSRYGKGRANRVDEMLDASSSTLTMLDATRTSRSCSTTRVRARRVDPGWSGESSWRTTTLILVGRTSSSPATGPRVRQAPTASAPSCGPSATGSRSCVWDRSSRSARGRTSSTAPHTRTPRRCSQLCRCLTSTTRGPGDLAFCPERCPVPWIRPQGVGSDPLPESRRHLRRGRANTRGPGHGHPVARHFAELQPVC